MKLYWNSFEQSLLINSLTLLSIATKLFRIQFSPVWTICSLALAGSICAMCGCVSSLLLCVCVLVDVDRSNMSIGYNNKFWQCGFEQKPDKLLNCLRCCFSNAPKMDNGTDSRFLFLVFRGRMPKTSEAVARIHRYHYILLDAKIIEFVLTIFGNEEVTHP